MRNFLATILFTLLSVGTAYGAANTTHGQECDADVKASLIKKGIYEVGECTNICNNHAAADDDAECTEHQFIGYGDLIVYEREENDANCSGDPTFTIKGGPVAGGTPSYDLDSTAVVLNDATPRAVIIMSSIVMPSFITIYVTNDAACTDVDVRMYVVTYKR